MSAERRPFTITKVEHHMPGYWTARVTDGAGNTVSVDNRAGSWFASVRERPRSQAWVRRNVLPYVAAELQRRVKSQRPSA